MIMVRLLSVVNQIVIIVERSKIMSEEMDLDLVEKVIHQLVKDWDSERDRDVAVWLISKLSYDDIEEYFRDLK